MNNGSKELIAWDSGGGEFIPGILPNEEAQLFGSISNFGHMDADRKLSLPLMQCYEDVKFSLAQKALTIPMIKKMSTLTPILKTDL